MFVFSLLALLILCGSVTALFLVIKALVLTIRNWSRSSRSVSPPTPNTINPMTKKIIAISFIYVCCVIAWLILGGTVQTRTDAQDSRLGYAVGQLWGGEQVQSAPRLEQAVVTQKRTVRQVTGGEPVTETREQTAWEPVALAGTRLDVDVDLAHRRKGLLWYPTYRAHLDGHYVIANPSRKAGLFRFHFAFPEQASVFDNFVFEVDGRQVGDARIEKGKLVREFQLGPGESKRLRVAYGTQGIGQWRYQFGDQVEQVRDFHLAMNTNFADVDFPHDALSPTRVEKAEGGRTLHWDYGTLVADAGVGLVMPQKLNPGPWVSRVTFFAPVSLFLFFFVLFVLTLLRGVRLHPMHYFFLGCSFFAFHLLLAYLVDHVAVGFALAVASSISVGLVVSYMRLVTGLRFALIEVGIAQLVYLVGFAFTFFLQGFTGLAVTGLSIATLFLVMQATGRLDWEHLFRRADQDGVAEQSKEHALA